MNLFEVIRDADGGMTPELIIWALFIGFSIALVLSLFSKRYMGKFVHALLKGKIDSPDSAKTLAELGFGKNPFVRMALTGKSAYSGLIFEKNEEVVVHGNSVVPVIRRNVDFSTARFFLPKVLVPRAEIRYEKKGNHIVAVVVGIILFFALSMVAIYYYPTVMAWVNEIL